MDTHGIRTDGEAEREATHSRALEEYGLLESEAEPELERIEGLAAQALRAPIAFISLLGRDRPSLKAQKNAQLYSAPNDLSVHLDILTREDPLVVPDLRGDPRLSRSPLAQENSGIRFYAGTALRSRAGQLIGALHVMDVKPRTAFSGADIGRLIDLAAVAMQVLEARRLKRRENAGDLAKGESERQFRILVEGISDYALYMLDPRGLVTSWNAGAEKIKGYSAEEIIGQHYSIFHTRADREAGAPEKALRIAAEAGRFETEALRERKDGSQFWANVIVDAIRTEAGELLGYAKITRDISERRRRDEELRRLALTDTLTGVENRYSILQQIDAAVSSGPAAVLAIDLDDFSKVNDFLGYEAGDRLLTDVARRMQEVVGHSGRIARVGGDEFVALLPGIADARTAVGIADSLIDALRSPFVVDDRTVSTPASVGAAVAPWHGRTASELISSANLALHHSKSRRGGGCTVFHDAFRQSVIARRACEEELRRAVAQSELELYYQPQIRLVDGAIVGAEALLRWNHPERGVLTPGTFLAVLDQSVLASVVGHWAVETGAAFCAYIRDRINGAFCVAVNLFGAQLSDGDLAARVLSTLERTGLVPDGLELELTENIVLEHDTAALEAMTKLRSEGVRISFDDFGTGYASLSMLKRVALTRLKIDQSFVRSINEDAKDATIVKAVIDLAQGFGLDVIAEGIETESQFATLKTLGCDLGQGYLFARPMPAAELEKRLRAS